jgi:hypothetical protein
MHRPNCFGIPTCHAGLAGRNRNRAFACVSSSAAARSNHPDLGLMLYARILTSS